MSTRYPTDTPVYIVYKMVNGSILTIESVHETRRLAEIARKIHAENAHQSPNRYYIARRIVNQTLWKQEVPKSGIAG